MTLSQISQFITVADSKSISKAADILYMNQPNLSQSIGHFEKEVGVRLFNRTNNGVTLTDEGWMCYEMCKEINEAMKRIASLSTIKEQDINTNSENTLNVSIASLNYDFLAETLSEFKSRHKDKTINFSLTESSGTLSLDLVEENKVDIAFNTVYSHTKARKLHQLRSKGLLMESIGVRPSGVFVKEGVDLCKEGTGYVDINKLQHRPLFVMEPGDVIYSEIVNYLKTKKINFRCAGVSKSSTYSSIYRAIKALEGFSIGTGPHAYDSGTRFIPFDPEEIPPASIVCIFKEDHILKPETLEFIELMRKYCEVNASFAWSKGVPIK